jgi:hypothetical protein
MPPIDIGSIELAVDGASENVTTAAMPLLMESAFKPTPRHVIVPMAPLQ